ncbi:MAG: hypothetical protein U0V70_13425 [Terriglobia bacterium]
MDTQTNKLLQQAGKYVMLGKHTHALEQYLKLHDLEPEDTTILNNIGDLYVRLNDKEAAVFWYTKLAETFALRQQLASAVTSYRKLLKITPKNQDVIMQLALLSERVGQKANAKNFYEMLAQQKQDLGENAEASILLQKASYLDPTCTQVLLKLSQCLELQGKSEDAARYYLQCANLLSERGKKQEAVQVIETVLRIRPKDKESMKGLFRLLQREGLTSKASDYLQSSVLTEDSELKLMMCELLITEGSLDAARQVLKENAPKNAAFYEPAVKLLKALLSRGEFEAALDLVDTIFDLSIQLHDEGTLRGILENLIAMNGSNVRLLKPLATLMIRMNDKLNLEPVLKALVTLQLREGNIRDAKESLNKLVVYGQADYYLDLLNLVAESSAASGPVPQVVVERVLQALEHGRLNKQENTEEPFSSLEVGNLRMDVVGDLSIEEEFLLEGINF